jgi:hypothetical protein
MVQEMVRINALIRVEDREFLRNQHIGITELFQGAILQRKAEQGEIPQGFLTEKKKREFFQKQFEDALNFIDKKGLMDSWVSKVTEPTPHGKIIQAVQTETIEGKK